eukprot:TRINITY_DN1335_c0_g2_i1.p1 TRINITY_DN1335_c0_g2~~TRINITY_DN1335_c0_g2_i1.p1  ORF type:complete len:414 (+),score=141.04 TRINITY_DN1335_c0_g2_i1:150-1391(+)
MGKKLPPPGIAPLKKEASYKDPVVDFKANGDIEVKLLGPDAQLITYLITKSGMGRYPFEDLVREQKPLGMGNQASVQLCEFKPTGEKLAMKECPFSKDINKSGLVSDLAHVLAVENHPNVVASHDVYFRDGHLMILMEYCSNGSLAELLDRGPRPNMKIPTDMLSCITAQVVKGLHHLHSKKIIHRDMKPSNILINKDGVVKICDFGVSKTTTEEQLVHTAVGAKAYLSPERVRSEGYFMPSDVWALGVTIAELALGDYPWKNRVDMMTELCEMLASGRASIEWPATGDYSDELKDFVAQCLISNTKERATTEQLLRHPFLLLTEGKDVKLSEWLHPKRPSSAKQSPWRKAKCPQGRVFYINTITNEKQWTRPPTTPTGSDWSIKYDREGRTWYVNSKTGVKTMERPADLPEC